MTELELALALKECDGNMVMAAKVLGLNKETVNERIKRSPQLFAMYGARSDFDPSGAEVPEVNDIDTITRTARNLPIAMEGHERAEQIMAQDRELMRTGLAAAGIKPETIEKIRSLDGLAANSGRMVSASLDYTHRLHIWSTAALFEEMMYIRDHHLRAEGQDPMVTVFWQRAFNEIADLLGKSNDRTMNTASALAAMMKARSKDRPDSAGSPKAKPGW